MLNRQVLILNANYVAIRIRTAREALTLVFAEKAVILDKDYQTYTWDEWTLLPVEEGQLGIPTSGESIRLPEIILLKKYNKIPRVTRLTKKKIFLRDAYRCQYTDKVVDPKEANIDHVIPRSQGGKFSWDNCVVCCKEINTKKGDRTPEQAGLKLIRKPKRPNVPILIDPKKKYPESWSKFIKTEQE
jgi:5-methylcytosine-specific restriction endonuclease McrA